MKYLNEITDNVDMFFNFLGREFSDLKFKLDESIRGEYTISIYSNSIPSLKFLCRFSIQEFPSNCAWMVVGGISGNLNIYNFPIILKVVEYIAKSFQYSAILVSGVADSGYINLWKESGYNTIFITYNWHSGNNVEMLAKEIKV